MKYLCRINYRVEVYTTCSWDIAVKHHTIFQFASIETRHSVTFRGKWSLISMLQDFLGEFWLLQRWNINLILRSIFTSSFNLCTVTPVHIFPTLFSTYFLWYWQGEFIKQSRASLARNHFIYSSLYSSMFDSELILWDEIRCQSLLGVKG